MLILFGYDADQVVDEWMSLFQERKHSILYEIERTWPVQTKVMMEETILSTYDVFQDSFTCQQRSPASCTKREERCLRSDFSKAGINKGNPATPWIMKVSHRNTC